MVVTPATLTETQAIQQLMASKGGAGACKAAAAAGLDPEAIREVLTAKAAAVKAGSGAIGGMKVAATGAIPPGVEPDLFQQGLTSKAGAAKAAGGTKIGMLGGAEPDLIREAVVSKAIGGTGTTIAAVGKGATGIAAATGGAATTEAITTSGTIWTGKGLSLGLGIGLGAWGPVLVAVGVGAAAYAYWRYRQTQIGTDEEIADEATDEGFYPAEANANG